MPQLTHLNHADACVFVTGHFKDGPLDLDWTRSTRPRQTVVYIGPPGVRELCRQLIAHGRPATTPAAMIEATQEDQIMVATTLATLPDAVQAAGLQGPTLIIVGDCEFSRPVWVVRA